MYIIIYRCVGTFMICIGAFTICHSFLNANILAVREMKRTNVRKYFHNSDYCAISVLAITSE